MAGWILLVTFGALTIGYSWWFLSGVIILVLWKLQRWYYYSSRPWRRVHFPMMRAYASASGIEAGKAETEEREFNLHSALLNLLTMVDPKLSVSHDKIIDREFRRCREFYDEPLIQHYSVCNKGFDEKRVTTLVEKIRKSMDARDKGLMVRMVIASVIEDQFSAEDRGEYMFEVFSGRQNERLRASEAQVSFAMEMRAINP